MKNTLLFSALLALLALPACSSSPTVEGKFKGEAWADNWFAMYLGEELVIEDSVSIDTERSFNAETFGFDGEFPLALNFILKDYKENDSGLEYIGSDKQQMGDGGFIFQLSDNTSGEILAVSSGSWKCKAVHRAPTNKDCEKSSSPQSDCQSDIQAEPATWKSADFDASGWDSATEHSESAVSPKEGYDEVSWDSSAKLIWTSDLETDNTLLCKVTVQGS